MEETHFKFLPSDQLFSLAVSIATIELRDGHDQNLEATNKDQNLHTKEKKCP